MAYRVNSLIYDKHNPERAFKAGSFVSVSDEERLKTMLEKGVVVEVADKDLPKETEVLELVEAPKEAPKKKAPAKKEDKE